MVCLNEKTRNHTICCRYNVLDHDFSTRRRRPPITSQIKTDQNQLATMATMTWRSSEARRLLEEDLRSGAIPLDWREMGVGEVYAQRPEFADFPFAPFGRRLQALRKQCGIKHSRSAADAMAMANDRQFVAQQLRAVGGGALRWDGSEAERLLRLDISNGLHQNLTPKVFHQSRVEFQVYTLKVFRGHIHQEVKRRKFVTSYYGHHDHNG